MKSIKVKPEIEREHVKFMVLETDNSQQKSTFLEIWQCLCVVPWTQTSLSKKLCTFFPCWELVTTVIMQIGPKAETLWMYHMGLGGSSGKEYNVHCRFVNIPWIWRMLFHNSVISTSPKFILIKLLCSLSIHAFHRFQAPLTHQMWS